MKICLVYDFLSEFGGLEREIANHAQILKKEGYDVEILTCYYDEEVIKKMGFSKDIRITNIAKIKTKYEIISLISCFLGLNNIKEIKTDAFISYSFPANYLLRKRAEKRINFMNHFPHFLYLEGKEKSEWASSTAGIKRKIVNFASFFIGRWLKKIDLEYVKKSKINFANSEFTKKRLDKIYGINCVVSYPPIDSVFKPSKKRINEEFIFSSSRIIPDKKYEWLIEAFSLMKNKIPLYISGQGNEEYTKELEETAKNKKVDIKFLGRIPTEKLVEYYSSARVFAFPTPGEDFGLVPAESLACGTPVVVWNDGAGPTEQITDGINGYYAKPYDIKDYAKKMDKALERNIKKNNAKKIVESSKKFSVEEVGRKFINEIQKVLSSSS